MAFTLRSSKFHRSSSHDGAASKNSPAMGFFTSSSDKYFSRIEPPTECPTNKTFPRSRDNSAEIFRFQDLPFGSASSGIRGKCTSYSPPSARSRDAASAASSSYAPLPPPCTNSTSVLVICASQVQSSPQQIVTCRLTNPSQPARATGDRRVEGPYRRVRLNAWLGHGIATSGTAPLDRTHRCAPRQYSVAVSP